MVARSPNTNDIKTYLFDLTGITTSGQSGPGSNGNEGYSILFKDTELEVHHQM